MLTSRGLVQKLKARIDDQIAYIRNRLHRAPQAPVQQYYWGRSFKAYGCGSAAVPVPNQVPVWCQLLLTPRLIVDILPISHAGFVARYGLDEAQMRDLAEEEFVIPNFYHYKSDAWQEYANYPEIAAMLARKGRPNTEWITWYLDQRYSFSDVDDTERAFLESIEVPLDEQKQLVHEACHDRIRDWSAFPRVYGQRLAYIKTLGGSEFVKVAEWIRQALQNADQRLSAIRVLNASKTLVASDITASYGGRYTLLPEHMEEIAEAFRVFEEIGVHVPLPGSQPRPEAAYDFAAELTEVNRKIRSHVTATGSIPRRLTTTQFKRAKQALRSVEDGRLGQLIEEMTASLASGKPPSKLTVDEYHDKVAELDSKLRQLAPLGLVLRGLGSALSVADEFPDLEPRNGPDVKLLFWIGNAFKILGAKLETSEMRPLLASPKTWRLCGYWLKVKRSLGVGKPCRS